MRRQLLSWSVALLLLSLAPAGAGAQESTLWVSPQTAFTFNSLITIGLGQPAQAARITTSSPGSYSVEIPLFIPTNQIVKSVQLCYWSSNAVNYIDRIIVGQMTTPVTLTNHLQDDTDLNSDTPTCYTTSVATVPNPYSPTGATVLHLTLVFTSSVGVIDIGAIGVNLEAQ